PLLPSLYNGMADQVAVQATANTSSLAPSFGATSATSAQLPVSQQAEVLQGGSGLLFSQPNPPLMFSGLLNPIPHETTKAQLGTGDSADRIIFDLSGPTDGTPGAT